MGKYINNDPQLGINYDWTKIRKEFRKLGIPADVYNPCVCPWEIAKYFVVNSERDVGKTTNFLLMGMIMFKMYGTQIQYIRQIENMIMPKSLKNLFATIVEYGYIEKLTEGEWNSVYYHSRRYYYAKADENGNITEIASTHFMFCCSVDKAIDLKSGYNAPVGDFIIFDEFIGKYYYGNEFVSFEDLLKTIIRGRRSPVVVMLANTLNPHSQYYNELEIYDKITTMHAGDTLTTKTSKGTVIYIELIGVTEKKKTKRSIINKLFFGFKNPLLGSITGESDWALDSYQHIPEVQEGEEEPEVITRRLYIFHNEKYVRLDVVKHCTLGLCVYAHWATKTYGDSYILTIEPRHDSRYHFKVGSGKVEKLLKTVIKENRIYYATNDIGSFVENYFKTVCKVM